MADKKLSEEEQLLKDLSRLIKKHDLAGGKTTIKIGPSSKTATDAVKCTPPKTPHTISVVLPNGKTQTVTICK